MLKQSKKETREQNRKAVFSVHGQRIPGNEPGTALFHFTLNAKLGVRMSISFLAR
jgi:hypothetical protein